MYEEGSHKTMYTYGMDGRVAQKTTALVDEVIPKNISESNKLTDVLQNGIIKKITTATGGNGENIYTDIAANHVGKLYYHNGYLGSANYLTEVKGNIRAVTTSDEWGNVRDGGNNDINIAGLDRTFGYTSYTYDKVLDLSFAQRRFYDGSDRRFISQNPVKDGVNWYRYCEGNPVRFVDPWGLIPTAVEAALMAQDVYKVYDDYLKSKKKGEKPGVRHIQGGWRYIDMRIGGDGMFMVIYDKEDNGKREYALVNKGTTKLSDWTNNAQQPFGYSDDMKASVAKAAEFKNSHRYSEITMIGHSKGGAEAAANALKTNSNAILFNPAALAPEILAAANYDIDINSYNSYSGRMTAYVVTDEPLNKLEGWAYESIYEIVELPNLNPFKKGDNLNEKYDKAYRNHSIEGVLESLHAAGYK